MKKAFTKDTDILDGWNMLTEPAQVEGVIAASGRRPQLVYKHSFTCGICHMAQENIEDHFNELSAKAEMHFVDVKKSREVSNAFTEQTGVRHESPQVLIIHNGQCVWHESHWAIKSDAILEAFENLESAEV